MKMGSVIVENGKKVLTMTEYIEREAILREIERRKALMVGDKLVSVDAMKSFIKNRPAADVVPVVRCQDCEYFRTNDENVPYCLNPFGLDDPEPNGFCSYGRRKNV